MSKVFQVRASLEKDVKKQEVMWEKQHEVAADKIYNMCSELGGFFLKVLLQLGKLSVYLFIMDFVSLFFISKF